MRRYLEKIEYSHLGVRNLSLHRNQKFKKAQFKVKKMPHRTSSPLKRPNHVKKKHKRVILTCHFTTDLHNQYTELKGPFPIPTLSN